MGGKLPPALDSSLNMSFADFLSDLQGGSGRPAEGQHLGDQGRHHRDEAAALFRRHASAGYHLRGGHSLAERDDEAEDARTASPIPRPI